MAQWVDIPLATQMGEDDSSYASDAELTNLMLSENPPGSPKPFHVASVPTLSTTGIAMPATGLLRGLCINTNAGLIFAVVGTTVYVSATGSTGGAWAVVNTMPGTAMCRSVFTGTHVVFVDGTNAVAFEADGLGGATTVSTEGWIDVTYQDGYTIYADALSDSLYVSDLDDPTTVGALNFTTVDAMPGNIIGIASVNRELLVYKTTSAEQYYNAGGPGFPFQRATPGMLERGCWPTWSADALSEVLQGVNTIQEHAGAVYWLGNDARVYTMQGFQQPRVISTPWVDRYLRDNLSDTDTVYGSAFTLRGRSYYLLSGMADSSGIQVALVYCVNNGLWHKRYSPIADHLQITHAINYHRVGDLSKEVLVAAKNTDSGNSTLYFLDVAGTNDSGASGQASRVMTLPQIEFGGGRAFMSELVIDMQKTATTGTITLSWSDDGGATYSSGITNAGANARTRFYRLGSFYQRILRLTFSVASKISVVGVRAKIEVGE